LQEIRLYAVTENDPVLGHLGTENQGGVGMYLAEGDFRSRHPAWPRFPHVWAIGSVGYRVRT
jgi:hypothetical protein